MRVRARTSLLRWAKPALGGVLLTSGLVAAGCTSRTVPLPPPIVQSLSKPDMDGYITVRGLAHEGAAVGVVNDRTLAGVVVTSPDEGCGSACPFEARIAAEVDDPIRVWQFFETANSRHITVPDR